MRRPRLQNVSQSTKMAAESPPPFSRPFFGGCSVLGESQHCTLGSPGIGKAVYTRHTARGDVAGLAAIEDGTDDVGGEIGEPGHALEMAFAHV